MAMFLLQLLLLLRADSFLGEPYIQSVMLFQHTYTLLLVLAFMSHYLDKLQGLSSVPTQNLV
jgi:hypothetical protein